MVYSFPWIGRARWIVVDVHDASYADLKHYKRAIVHYEASDKWRTVYSSHGVTVLRKP